MTDSGIQQQLDYLNNMGFTAIWLNPILENDQPRWSYHGYATTDYYQVDRRFGSNEEYKALVDAARAKGMKVIMDMIMNHCGSKHWWMEELPTANWINNGGEYTQTTHRRTTLHDPYAARVDVEGFSDGWFVEEMPDLNQRQPLLAVERIPGQDFVVDVVRVARMSPKPHRLEGLEILAPRKSHLETTFHRVA